MATKPHLKAVPTIANNLIQLIDAMSDLRQRIADLFDNDSTVRIELGEDMASFAISIYLQPLADHTRTEFLLGINPLRSEGIIFSKIHTTVLERSCRRRVVHATISSNPVPE